MASINADRLRDASKWADAKLDTPPGTATRGRRPFPPSGYAAVLSRLQGMGRGRSQGTYVLLLLLVTVFSVLLLPRLVNGVAYLIGAEPTATFTAMYHAQQCGSRGCRYYTAGILEPGGTSADWPGWVQVGSSFPVRAPVWSFADGKTINSSTGDAVWFVFIGVLVNLIVIGFWVPVVRWASCLPARRRSARGSAEPAKRPL